jgi:Domain of Unknown Function with PDB structure (DUF3857)/Transglutaminase-like superfamily
MRKPLTITAITLVSVTLGLSKPKVKEAPSWVTEVATRATPAFSGRVPAVVLFYEQKVNVDSLGMMTTVTRRAVKILTHEGKREAQAAESYEQDGSEVKELRAWLVAPSGFVKTFDKSDIGDLGIYSDDLYNDFRVRQVSAANPELGSVFIYESEVQRKATEAQDRFFFQDRLPCLESRYAITAPAGWIISGHMLNQSDVQPVIDGNTYTWSLRGLPFHEREEFAPRLFGVMPELAIDFRPPAGVADPPSFKTWEDVSRWHTSIASTQADITPEMEAKVRDLTAGAKTEYDKIRAIGHFVQKFRYVEIAMDLSRNGGVRPHPAPQVFAKQYGDCKDKANLMLALLKSAGIPSYLVAIYSGDRTYVKNEWPSPSQFNHMIVAISVSQSVNGPTVIESPIGRVLLFDPTDEYTPMGDLPFYEQGSYALLCAGARGGLVRVPVIAPGANLLSQTVSATLTGQGSLTASVTFEWIGQASARERAHYHSGSPEQYKSAMEEYLSVYAKGAAVRNVKAADFFEQGRFQANIDFSSEQYGQLMQGRMLVFNPAILEPNAMRLPVKKERSQPVILNGRTYRKHVTIQLPSGFNVDEMPVPFEAEAPFARFKIAYRQENGQLVVDEELRTETVTLPATDYPKVKKFFDDALGADNQNLVLVKN